MGRMIFLLVWTIGCGEQAPVVCKSNSFRLDGRAADPGAPVDRSCLGKPAVSGCDTLQFSGLASQIVLRIGVPQAKYEFFDEKGALVRSVITDDDGSYSTKIHVGAAGFKGRVKLSKEGYRSHDVYLNSLIVGASHDDLTLGIELETDLQRLLPAFGSIPPDPAKAIIDPIILDCSYRWLPPVVVEIDRPYEKRYYVDGSSGTNMVREDVSASIAGELSGALFVNVDPGPVVATFRAADTGEVLATASGEAVPGYWTALSAFPN